MPQETVLNHSEISSHSEPPTSGPPPSGPPEVRGESELDLLDLIRVLLQNKFVILKFSLVPAVLTAIVVLIVKPYYAGVSSFLPPNSMSTGASSLMSQLGVLGMAGGALGGLKDPTLIYVGILQSRTVADDLIQQFDLAKIYKTKKLSQTENVLKAHTKIAAGKDSIVVITVKENDPKLAADLANAYLAALHKQNDRIAFTEAGQKRLFFEQQLEKEKDLLAEAEVEMARTQEKSGLIQPSGQAQLQIQTIAQTQAQIASLEVELAAMSQAATSENPDVIRIKSQIEGLRAQLAKLENSGTRGGPGNIQVPTSKVPELTLTYMRKARNVKYHEALYELLMRQYASAKLDEAHSAPLVQVVDYAVVPDSKAGPPRTLLTLLAAILGGFIGAVRVFFRHTMGISRAAEA
jgi:tyrosine-protein kinase Etk/Wzc